MPPPPPPPPPFLCPCFRTEDAQVLLTRGATRWARRAMAPPFLYLHLPFDGCSSCKITEFLLSKGIPVDIDPGYSIPLYHAVNCEKDKTINILPDRHDNSNIIFRHTGTGILFLGDLKLFIKASASFISMVQNWQAIPVALSYC
ncbi:hypothetical protein ACP4OV_001878 [Aristida adscensionis]